MNVATSLHNDFTQTNGCGEDIKREFKLNIDLSNFEGLSNLGEYKSFLNSKYSTPKIKQYYGGFLNRLDLLKSKLEEVFINSVDPIEYLIYLYYQEGIDIRGISKRLKEYFDISYPNKSLSQNLTVNLGWKLRDKNESSDLTRTKNKNKIRKRNKKSKANKLDKTNELIEILIDNKRDTKIFDIQKYNSRKNNTSKMIYLLDIFGYLKEGEFTKKIEDLKQNYSSRIIANAFQEIINKEILNNGIQITLNITNQRISEILKIKNPD